MKTRRMSIILLLVLCVAVLLFTVWHFSTRNVVESGKVQIITASSKTELTFDKIDLIEIHGQVVNGKGEERSVDGKGALLSSVLTTAGVTVQTEVKVTSDDEYSAVVTAEEIFAPDKVYLMLQEDGQIQMVVFGDANSKRNVTNVKMIELS